MSLVVADSSPIRYLLVCGAIEIIPELYGNLVIPSNVIRELSHTLAPVEVRRWASALPAWASVQTAAQLDPASQLGLGEREAIALAIEIKAEQLLLDDRAARRVAMLHGLLVAGTIGVLEKASERNLVDLLSVFGKLRQTNFRWEERIFREALQRQAARQALRRDREIGR